MNLASALMACLTSVPSKVELTLYFYILLFAENFIFLCNFREEKENVGTATSNNRKINFAVTPTGKSSQGSLLATPRSGGGTLPKTGPTTPLSNSKLVTPKSNSAYRTPTSLAKSRIAGLKSSNIFSAL